MKLTITLSANAGVCICLDDRKIWIDALHEQKQKGFSAVDELLLERIFNSPVFSAPDYICYTHCHADHFSRAMTDRAKLLWPDAKLILPQRYFADQLLVTGEGLSVTDKGLSVHFFRLPHEGELYRNTVHYGILIQYCGKSILIPGDCQIAADALLAFLNNRMVDVALLDFPWITLNRGRKFLSEQLAGAEIVLYHLPFAQDDISDYRIITEKAAAASVMLKTHILQDPLSQIILEI